MHELQHYAQRIEGFSNGGSPLRMARERNKRLSEEAERNINDAKVKNKSIVTEIAKLFIEYKEDGRSKLGFVDNMQTYSDYTENPTDFPFDDLRLYPQTEKQKALAEDIRELQTHLIKESKVKHYYDESITDEDYNSYRNLAGEVEARTAANRRTLSLEERRNSLFTDDMYKDVAKEDLIFLQESLDNGIAESRSRYLRNIETDKKSITNQLIGHLKSIGIKVRNRRDMIKYLREHGLAGLLKFIGRKARTKFEQQLLRARPDMTNAEIKATLDFLHSLEDNKENTAYIKTAVRWVANRSITLPQDNTKARLAFDLARKKHIDLQKYNTLGELITSDEMKPKEREKKSFDPDTAKTFSNKRTVTTEGGRVFTVYDVENTEEGQREVCKALAAHYKMSPWCLSTFTATGEPTQSARHYWDHYNAIPRKIAYENGKPVAFNSSHTKGEVDGILRRWPAQKSSDGTFYIMYAESPLAQDTFEEWVKEGILRHGPLSSAFIVTKKGEKEIEEVSNDAWWDMNDMYPQNILSDSIVSNYDRVQTGNPQLPADPENMNDWWQAQHEIGPAEDYYDQDPQEYFYMDVHNAILNIVNDEISSILESRNLVPEGGNLVWYRNMLSQHYIDSANINMLRVDEIVPDLQATTHEIAQAIIAEYNIFDNIRSTIEQEIENLPQPAEPINPDPYGLYTQLDRYSDEYLLDLINDNLDLVQVETARQILINRQEAREAGDYLPFFITPSGEIYGFVTPDGDIYLDETIISPEHPIHEYTHMWDRTVAEKNSTLWKRGVELMKQIPLWEQIENNPNYGQRWKKMSDMTEDRFEFLVASEVHSRLVGEEGSKLLDRIAKQKGKRGIVAKLKQWILDFWKDLKSTFSDWSESDIQKLTLDDFNHMTVRDFADGVNFNNALSDEFKSQLQKLGAELMERCKG